MMRPAGSLGSELQPLTFFRTGLVRTVKIRLPPYHLQSHRVSTKADSRPGTKLIDRKKNQASFTLTCALAEARAQRVVRSSSSRACVALARSAPTRCKTPGGAHAARTGARTQNRRSRAAAGATRARTVTTARLAARGNAGRRYIYADEESGPREEPEWLIKQHGSRRRRGGAAASPTLGPRRASGRAARARPSRGAPAP